MKHWNPLSLSIPGAALALFAVTAQAQDLLLRLSADARLGSTSLDISHAQRGSFAQPGAKRTPREGDLLVIGRNAQGQELFRRSVANPSRKTAAIFHEDTGQIELSRPLAAQGAIELSIPEPSQLASIELSEYRSQLGLSATPGRRLGRKELDALVQRTEQQNTLAASAVPTGSTLLWESGSSAQRMDIVIIGDGFTRAEMPAWQTAAKRVSDGILADPLFARCKGALNIRRVDIESAQSGVSEGGVVRNSALGSQVGCFNIARLVCTDEAKVLAAVSAVAPANGRDVIIVLVNSSTYAGAAAAISAASPCTPSRSKSPCMRSAMPRSSWPTNTTTEAATPAANPAPPMSPAWPRAAGSNGRR